MIKITAKGDFKKTSSFLERVIYLDYKHILVKYAKRGLQALIENTPVDTGETAASWGYEIAETASGYAIYWTNSHIEDGVPIAVILQYGHGTGTGGYVQGVDYINPALRPIFEGIANEAWKEVTAR